MRFELLRQRVERAEQRMERCQHNVDTQWEGLAQAWRSGWSPGRIVVVGLLGGFLAGRAEPMARVGGARWLQMLGTVSSMIATVRAAAAEVAAEAAEQAADQANDARPDAAPPAARGDAAPAPAHTVPPAPTPGQQGAAQRQAPRPAEAATEMSER